MVILGLTGSIGMGKSTAATMLRRLGVPVHDSDAAVHDMLAKGGSAVAPIVDAFPGVDRDGAVDRQELGRRVFGDPEALRTLEDIIHPRVHRSQEAFLRRAAARRASLAVLDIPLLFETNGDERCDATVVVSAPSFLQRQRVLGRPGMTEDKLDGILSRQMPDAEKRRRADFVVPTNGARRLTLNRLRAIVRFLKTRRGRKWPPRALRLWRNDDA